MFSVLFKTPITHDFNNHLYVSVCAKSLHKVLLFVTLGTVAHQVLCPRDSLGKNTGVGCHDLLQGIFPIQGSNPNLLQLLNAGRFFTAEPPGKPNPTPSDHLVRSVLNDNNLSDHIVLLWNTLCSFSHSTLPTPQRLT